MNYEVRIYRTLVGRYAFKSVKSGYCSNKSWASRSYAAKVARECGMVVVG
jgi:hypothetical protein